VDFDISIDIAAPPDVVWRVMSDVERWHEWTASIRGIRLLDKGPLRVGSRALVRQPRFPPALWKVAELDAGRSFTWITSAPGMRVSGRHSVVPHGAGSRANLHLHYEGPIARLLARMTRDITDRYLGYEANGLKKRSEAGAAAQ
jgi:hypothetical protein